MINVTLSVDKDFLVMPRKINWLDKSIVFQKQNIGLWSATIAGIL